MQTRRTQQTRTKGGAAEANHCTGSVCINCFQFLQAMFDYNVLYNSTNPTTAMILFMVYEVKSCHCYPLAGCLYHNFRMYAQSKGG